MPKPTKSNFPADEIAEEFFQRSVRVTQILPLIGLVHHESLEDPWEDFLRDPGAEFNKIIKDRFGIDGDKYESEGELARAIMMKNDNGYIVCYDIPVIQDIFGKKGHETLSSYGFGHCQRHSLYLEKVDNEGLNAVLDHAEENIEAMKNKLRAANKRKGKKKGKKGRR